MAFWQWTRSTRLALVFVHAPHRPCRPRAVQAAQGRLRGNIQRLSGVFAQLDQLDPRPHGRRASRDRAHRLLPRGRRSRPRGHGRSAGARSRCGATARGTSSGSRSTSTLGFYEIWRNKLYNSAMYVTLGDGDPRIRHVHRKVFLPTYGLFDEERFVERGRDVRAFDTPWGRAAMLVCEDAWHSMTATIAALDGAQVDFRVRRAAGARCVARRPTTFPVRRASSRWDRLTRDIADEHGVFVALTNLVGSEGGKMFPGGSLVVGRARARYAAARRCGKRRSCRCTHRSGRRHARARRHAAHRRSRDDDAAPASEHRRRRERHTVDVRVRRSRRSTDSEGAADARQRHRASDASSDADRVQVIRGRALRGQPPSPLDIDRPSPSSGSSISSATRWRGADSKRRGRRLGRRRLGGDGVSRREGARTRANVLGVRMPYRTSSKESLDHAQLVIDALGISRGRSTSAPRSTAICSNEPDAEGGRRGNVMARMRMIALFDLAAKHRGSRSARATRRSGCSAISPGTPTTRRRSTRSAICSRRRCGRSRVTSACPR